MKTRIFSKGQGWYISATNHKDQNDKCYINLYFPKNTDPVYQDNGRGFSMKDIDIEDAKFTSYKNKAGLTIFKYTEIKEGPEQNSEAYQIPLSNGNSDMFGHTNNLISSDDLPFY